MAYGSDTEFQVYAAEQGATVPATEVERDQLRAKASRFVDSLGWRMEASGVPTPLFPGRPSAADQELQWPRTGATDAYGNDIANDRVPTAIERATYEAAIYEASNPGGLNEAVRADQRVTKEKFDTVEFTYSDASTGATGAASAPVIPAVMTLLAPYMGGAGNRYGVTMVVA